MTFVARCPTTSLGARLGDHLVPEGAPTSGKRDRGIRPPLRGPVGTVPERLAAGSSFADAGKREPRERPGR
jgi:hypothetical protein